MKTFSFAVMLVQAMCFSQYASASNTVTKLAKGQSLVVCKETLRDLNNTLASPMISVQLTNTVTAEIDAPFIVSAPSVSQYIASTSGSNVQYGWEVCVTVTKQ